MSLDEGVSNLIGDIYAGAHDPEAWDRAVQGLLARTHTYCAEVAVLDLRHLDRVSDHFYGPDETRFTNGVRDYRAEFERMNICFPFSERHPDARFVTPHLAAAEAAFDCEDHPFMRWLNDAWGAKSAMCCYTPSVDDLTFTIGLIPDAERGAHDEDDQRLFVMLFEHFERAMRAVMRPPEFESPDAAWLLLDRRGVVRAASEAAEALLAANDGLALAGGRLLAGRRDDAARLDGVVRAALHALEEGATGGAVRIARPSGRRHLAVTVSPLPAPATPFEAVGPAAVVRIVDPEAGAQTKELSLWASSFGLTPTELRLVEALLGPDGSLRDAADRLEMAYATARVHLAHVFDKVSVRSQAQLARVLTRIAG